MWTSLPNLWAFSPVSRIEIGSGIILETSFNNNSVFLSFSIINNVLWLLYLYFMFRFFCNAYCIFSGQPFSAGFDLIFISGCACSKMSAVVEIKPLHIYAEMCFVFSFTTLHTPDGLSAQPCHCASVQASCAEVFLLVKNNMSTVLCTTSLALTQVVFV